MRGTQLNLSHIVSSYDFTLLANIDIALLREYNATVL